MTSTTSYGMLQVGLVRVSGGAFSNRGFIAVLSSSRGGTAAAGAGVERFVSAGQRSEQFVYTSRGAEPGIGDVGLLGQPTSLVVGDIVIPAITIDPPDLDPPSAPRVSIHFSKSTLYSEFRTPLSTADPDATEPSSTPSSSTDASHAASGMTEVDALLSLLGTDIPTYGSHDRVCSI